jgi:hypothetical protein
MFANTFSFFILLVMYPRSLMAIRILCDCITQYYDVMGRYLKSLR